MNLIDDIVRWWVWMEMKRSLKVSLNGYNIKMIYMVIQITLLHLRHETSLVNRRGQERFRIRTFRQSGLKHGSKSWVLEGDWFERHPCWCPRVYEEVFKRTSSQMLRLKFVAGVRLWERSKPADILPDGHQSSALSSRLKNTQDRGTDHELEWFESYQPKPLQLSALMYVSTVSLT